MYILHSNGSWTAPCVTPNRSSDQLLKQLTLVLCPLFDQKKFRKKP